MICLWGDAWVVRAVEGNITKERPVTLLAADELDGTIGEHGDRMLAGKSLVSKGAVCGDVLHGQFIRIAHAAKENSLAFLKGTPQRRRFIMPFAADKGLIAGLPENFRPGRLALEFFSEAEKSTAGHQHGARGHADRALERSHAIGAGEGCSLVDKSIQIWRLNELVAQRVDG